MKRPALMLDRDGVINVDAGYVHRPEDIVFVDGIFELVRRANALEWPVAVVTNQAGIGRGLYTEAQFDALMDWMRSEFRAQGAAIAGVYHCPFHPDHGVGRYKREHVDRKPGPGMILRAARAHAVDLRRSVLIGDRETDIEAGIAAGVGCTLLYRTEATIASDPTAATAVIDRLADALRYLQPATRGEAVTP